jgi:hypothetical protein
MTWQLTVRPGLANVTGPDGQRRQGGDSFIISDRQYGSMTAAALAAFYSKSYLGGTVSHQVTVAPGLRDVVLPVRPGGRRCQGGEVITLSDEEYGTISASTRTALFSADTASLT